MFRSSNPVLKESTFDGYAYITGQPAAAKMTVSGTINKALILFAILVACAVTGGFLTVTTPSLALPIIIVGALSGLVIAITLTFKRELAPTLAPVYAVAQGLAVGAISVFYEAMYRGIIIQAVAGTFGILGLMLVLYRTGVLRATPIFVKTVVFATLGIACMYLVSFVMMMFGGKMPLLHDATPVGIVISVVICIVAALNFILDFDLIEKGSEAGAPKYMEWYAGFGLLVTLVWLYLELLRLISKINRR
jgi:uncharacterized YccA/Bax inhibitor family protein